MLSQQTYALPPLTTLSIVGFHAKLAIKRKKKKNCNSKQLQQTQILSSHSAASPGNPSGHKTGMNCRRTFLQSDIGAGTLLKVHE